MAQQPTTILADEPVASLDPATSEKILGMLHRICREDHLTAVVSLHQVELAKMFSDRVIGLSDGGIVFDDIADRLTGDVYHQIYGKRKEALKYSTEIPN